MITTPRAAYACHVLTSIGISARHGPHQEAQKLTTTGCPRRSANARRPPAAGNAANGAEDGLAPGDSTVRTNGGAGAGRSSSGPGCPGRAAVFGNGAPGV